jgi:hypothetical protein
MKQMGPRFWFVLVRHDESRLQSACAAGGWQRGVDGQFSETETDFKTKSSTSSSRTMHQHHYKIKLKRKKN